MSELSPLLEFCDDWDRQLAESGPPALFTQDPDGQLRLAPDRTRDARRHSTGPFEPGLRHCLFRDRATGLVHYGLSTSPGLCNGHPRLEVRVYPDQESALQALSALGRPPVQRT